MRNILLRNSILIAIASAAMAVVLLGCVSTANSRNDDEAIRAVERERLRSLVEADLATAEQLHAGDFQLINPFGGSLTKEQYLGAIRSGVLDYLVWDPGTIDVRANGNNAVIRYQSRLEVVFQGQKIPLRSYWHTDYYERREGRWQVVWSQATEIRSQ